MTVRDVGRRSVLAALAGSAGCLAGNSPPDAFSTTTGRERTESGTTTSTTTSSTTTPDPDPITLGALFPASGTFSAFGSPMLNAAQLAVSDVNAAGGVLGRPLELVPRDSESDLATDQKAYQNLTQQVVGLVHLPLSYHRGRFGDLAAESRTVRVLADDLPPSLPNRGRADGQKYVASTFRDGRQVGAAIGLALSDDRFVGADTATILVPQTRGVLARIAVDAFDGDAVTVEYDPHAEEYSEVVERTYESDPDGIGFFGHSATADSDILAELTTREYVGSWVADPYSSVSALQTNIDAETYRVDPAPKTTDSTQTVRKRLDSVKQGVLSAYDAVYLLALSLQQAGTVNGPAVAGNLRRVARSPGTTILAGEFPSKTSSSDSVGDLDYQGASSALRLNRALAPLVRFAVEEFKSDSGRSLAGHLPVTAFEMLR